MINFRKYTAKEDKASKQKVQRWQKEQALPLMVYIETEKGWQLADYFPTIGNTASRDMIMAINLPETGKSSVRIKIESTFMLWELDYAAMDFSADKVYKPQFINVSDAVRSNNGASEVNNLSGNDKQYTKLLQNEFVAVEFKKPETDSAEQSSYFLLSSGYYHSLKRYSGKPDLGKLKYFKKKGAINKFSETKFEKARKMIAMQQSKR